MWALSDKLVLSYVNETRVLAFSTGGKADGMDEQDEEDDGGIEELGAHDGFDLSRPTLLAFQTESGQVGQVTAQGITTFTGVQWSPPDGRKITLASSAGPYVLVALAGGEVILLHTSEGLVVQGQQNMQNEVACLDISSLDTSDGGKAYIASAGLWNEYAVVTMSVPALEVTDTIKLDTTFLLRSVLAITLSAPAEGSSSNEPGNPSSSGNYLFVGLGDGSLVSYALNGSANPSKPFKVSPESRKTLSLGSRPVTMTRIETGGAVPGGGEESVQRQAAPAVFVTSDRSTIVNAENGKLSYASVNTKVGLLLKHDLARTGLTGVHPCFRLSSGRHLRCWLLQRSLPFSPSPRDAFSTHHRPHRLAPEAACPHSSSRRRSAPPDLLLPCSPRVRSGLPP